MTKNIKQQVLIGALPVEVFEALMSDTKHGRFTGEPARIARRVGGAFSCYGHYITGITLELKPSKQIIQAWRSRNWPPGTYSIVTFNLAKSPGGKTRLTFSQVGVPAGDYNRKSKGWRTHYWEPLQRYFQDH
jgi:uncharacterized protein YndB with AHSA1/START domain